MWDFTFIEIDRGFVYTKIARLAQNAARHRIPFTHTLLHPLVIHSTYSFLSFTLVIHSLQSFILAFSPVIQ